MDSNFYDPNGRKEYVLNFDGSCWPNPGPVAGYGYVIRFNGFLRHTASEKLPSYNSQVYTNNYAELYALYKGLEQINSNGDAKIVHVRGDSQFTINLMKGICRPTKTKIYYNAYCFAKEELQKLRKNNVTVVFDWIPRELNSEADKLSR